jgi:hypothetical protein
MANRSRLQALLSTPFLWLIGVALFLPTVKACERVESPASLLRGELLPWAPLLSPFLVAELLAVIVLLALLLHAVPSRRWYRATLALTLPLFASPATLVYCFLERPTHLTDQLFALGSTLAMGLAAAVLVRGARGDGWRRIGSCLSAYTILTLPLAIWFLCICVEDHGRTMYAGGWCFFAGVLGLGVVSGMRAITRA